jgi:glycosyltransferase involved in cell wall biosynthesis
MHVLMVSKACLVGAYQRKLEAIARHEEVKLTVIVPPSWNDPAGAVRLERSHTQGYDLLVDPIRFNGSYHFHYYPGLRARIESLKPDILHMDEEPYNLATWLAMRHAGRIGAKRLFFSWQNLHQTYPLPFRLMEKQVLKVADHAIVGNHASKKVWRDKGFAGPISVIPQFGVDPTLFAPSSESDEGRSFVIGAAGRRLVPEKGLDLLLEAAANLPGIWRLHIAGEGPLLPKLKAQARDLNIGDRVFFDGVVPSDQMPAYLKQLDVLALPSRTLPNWKEQFGRILVEAMACGVVVVGSDSGEIPNVIGEAGLVFPEDDKEALQAHRTRLIQDAGLRRRLAQAGRERVLENYTQAQIASKTMTVYRTL